jgi:hypothetical protein
MQTMRLFAYQRPSRIAALPESLLRGCPALQVGSYEMDGKLGVWDAGMVCLDG